MQSIDIFPWNEHFNTGIDTIDEQHAKLVEILNRLATHVAYESNEDDLSSIFDELIDYTVYHFQTEEAIWEKYISHDNLTIEHNKVHQKFIDVAVRLNVEKDVKPLSELADEALGFLAKWLASHILDTDRFMAYTVFAIEDGLSIEEARISAQEKMSGSSRLLINIILSIYSTLSSNTLKLMRELKTHIIFEQTVNYQEKYRQLLLNLSTSFINLPLEQIDSAIKDSLENMAKFVDADRAYIFDYDMDKNTTTNTYEWCGEGISTHIDELQNFDLDIIPEWLATHIMGKVVLVPDVSLMPHSEIKGILISQKIQSLVTIPLMQNNICRGFVGFDSVKTKHDFSDDEIELLDLFGKLLANIDDRKQIESELSHERSFLKTLINTIPDLVWLKDPDGTYLACNTRFEDLYGAKESEIVGKNDYDFVDKELADFFRKHDKKAMNSDKPSMNEEEILFANDGHKEIVQTTKVSMHDKDGKLIGVLGTARDITQNKELQKNLMMERDRFEQYLETVEAMIVSLDSDGKIILINRKGCEILGYTQEELIGKEWFSTCLAQPEGMQKVYPIFLSIMNGNLQGTEYFENNIMTKSGDKRLIAWHNSYLRDENGKIVSTLSAGEDITERQQHQRHLEYIAHYDALTGLPNRVLLSDRIYQALRQAHRHKLSLAVVYLDLDGFKAINDTYGHENGDKFLAILAQHMKTSLREGDTIARLGGDEFVAVLLDLKKHNDAVPMLKRLLQASSQKIIVDDIEMQVTASLGVTFFDASDELDADQLLRQADQAMYQAKLLGKDRYYIFDALKDKKIRTHHESLDEIEMALLNNEFVLYYQPKVNMRSGKVVGVEALIRWNHPERGILAPEMFLPIIQGHILSVKLGEWVINRAMEQIQEWKSKDIDIPISVNVDAMQLQQNDFIEQLITLLAKFPTVKPSNLVLEVLETSALEDITHISQIMQECSKIGISFSLDDFGTGYSSLTYLKRLPAKELKIDQSFVRGMLEDPDDLAILDGVLGLASAFRREVIAEGVESIEHGEMLLKLGCKIAQGYVIARPMPPEDISGWIKQYKVDEKWKNTAPISRNDLPLLYAVVEHKAWLNNILAYFKNTRRIPPTLNHHECRFGVWLYESAMERYNDSPEFEEVEKMHRKLHEKINIFVKEHADNSLENLEAPIDEIKNLSKNLINAFKKFEVARREHSLLES